MKRENCDVCWWNGSCYYKDNSPLVHQFKCICCGVEQDCPNLFAWPESKDINLCCVCYNYIRKIKKGFQYEFTDDYLYIKLKSGNYLAEDRDFYIFSEKIISFFINEFSLEVIKL